MMNYKTQMEAAKRGVITEAVKEVAAKERIDIAVLMDKIANGRIVILANKNHKCLKPCGIGEGLKTKVNVNLGVSNDCCNRDLEYKKALLAEKLEADALMDLSCFGDTREFREKLVNNISIPLGTVPMYDTMIYHNKELKELTAHDFLEAARCHAEDGIDFLTIHAGLNRKTAERLDKNNRLTNIVSRVTIFFANKGFTAGNELLVYHPIYEIGGSILYSMHYTGNENPFVPFTNISMNF